MKGSIEKRLPSTWTDFCRLRWTGREKVPSRIGKNGLRSYLISKGIPHLRMLRSFSSASEISFDGLPGSFVLKPEGLWSSKGVMVLHRIADTNLFFEAMKRTILSSAEIMREQMSLQKQAGRDIGFIIEEKAVDEDISYLVPLDYKVFTFFGRVKFILQVDRNHDKPKLNFFDEDFEPITDGRVFLPNGREERLGVPRRPRCANELIKMAAEVTIDLKIPFVSVDCYATKDGGRYGELTHTPGGPWFGLMYRFSDAFDRELGQEWARAATALGREIALMEAKYDIDLRGKVVRTVG